MGSRTLLTFSTTFLLVSGLVASCGGTSTGRGPVADGGVTEGGPAGPYDAGDGNVCVNIDPSSYTQACNQTSDCTVILINAVCSGMCQCSGWAINVSGKARYESAVSEIKFAPCNCPPPVADCFANTCGVIG